MRLDLCQLRVIFDQVQRGLPIGPFRLAPRADIPPAPVLYECTALDDQQRRRLLVQELA